MLNRVTNESGLALKACHVPLTVFYRPVKALLKCQIFPCVLADKSFQIFSLLSTSSGECKVKNERL